MQTLANEIEAILYLKGQALSLENLAEYLGCNTDTVADGIIELMGDYAHRDSALEVVESSGGHYALQLKESFKSLRDKIIPSEIGTGALPDRPVRTSRNARWQRLSTYSRIG
jgi:segregation and condensation protein B